MFWSVVYMMINVKKKILKDLLLKSLAKMKRDISLEVCLLIQGCYVCGGVEEVCHP